MKKEIPASARGWELLAQLVLERSKRLGPDGDLADDEKAEELDDVAEGTRKLLNLPAFQRLRLKGMEAIANDFVAWLEMNPLGANYDRELKELHIQAASRYWELFRPEMVIKEARDAQRRRAERKEEVHAGIRKA